MKKKMVLVLFATVVVGGCAVRSTVVNGPDGKQAIAMRCRSMAYCFKAAGEQCPNGYETLDQMATVSGGGSFGGYGGQVRTGGSMLFRCK